MDWQTAASAAGRIAGAAAQDAPQGLRALETLEELRGLIPFLGASLSAWDEERGAHVVVAEAGYRDETLGALNGQSYLDDPTWHVTYGRRVPVPWRDMPFAPEESPIIRDSLLPCGYREGMTAPFFRSDGGYSGMLTLNTDSVSEPSEAALEMLRLLSPRLSDVVDGAPAASTPSAPGLGHHRFAVSAGGLCTPLDDDRVPPPELVETIRGCLRAGPGAASFLVWERGERLPWHVAVETAAEAGLAGIVTCTRSSVPERLSRRELEVLAGLVVGLSNQEIADALRASRRTISTHVEHILAKLGVRSRTEAATRAAREGLHLPGALLTGV
jgi:DNA-binding CsgD family transcriptional regulator